MVQINLPQNSKVQKGKYYKDQTGSKNIRRVNIYRWDPSTGENPRIDTYEVDMDNCPTKVLDLLNKIKNDVAASFQKKIIEILIKKTDLVLKNLKKQKYNIKDIALVGGVAANKSIKKSFEKFISNS